jgi:hypothetical protein
VLLYRVIYTLSTPTFIIFATFRQNKYQPMLIHDKFRKDLVMHSFEDTGDWQEYDFTYMLHMKRYVKQQLLAMFPNPQGMKFMVQHPIVLRKQLPVIMAIWELGGILVIYDLHPSLLGNPLYKEFHDNIDACFVEHGDVEFGGLATFLKVFADQNKLYELKFWDLDQSFGNIEEDLVYATGDNIAIMVNTSGTTQAPQQVYYSHDQCLQFMQANIDHMFMKEDEHVLHLKTFHHGGLCINYLMPMLTLAKNHYFKVNVFSGTLTPIHDMVAEIISQKPINRILFPHEVTDSTISALENVKAVGNYLTIQCTHNIVPVDRIDRMFATGNVHRFISQFGCGEIPAPYLFQILTHDTWQEQRNHWNHLVFTEPNSTFWEYQLFETGLGVRCAPMPDWHVAGDNFEKLENGNWHWLGRTSQIKREGRIVFPAAVAEVLKESFPELQTYVIADYQHKKLYSLVVSNSPVKIDELLTSFNNIVECKIDRDHLLDLVINSKPGELTGGGKVVSEAAVRFQARKYLGLDTTV